MRFGFCAAKRIAHGETLRSKLKGLIEGPIKMNQTDLSSPPLPNMRPIRHPRMARPPRPMLQIAPALILVAAILMPPEVRFTLAGNALYSYRLAYLVLVPWMLWQIIRQRQDYRLPDLLVLLSAVWIIIAFIVVYGVGRGLTSGLGVALDSTVPYFVARFSFRRLDDLRRFLVVLAPVILVLVAILCLEAVTHSRFTREFAQLIFGQLGAAEYGETNLPAIQSDTRYGLLRAMGPFSHPILAGTFMASYLALVLFSRIRGWPFWAGLAAAVGAIVTLSSAALLGLLLVAVLAFYERFQRLVRFLNWPLFVGLTGAVLLTLHFVSENGLINVLIRYTLNPQTGYFRLLIWEYGALSVANYPWFGIGYEPYVRPAFMLTDSVDAFWLFLSMRNGLPATILLGAAVRISIFSASMAALRIRTAESETVRGVVIALTVMSVLGFTVSFFGGMLIWYFIILGLTTSLASIAAQPTVKARHMQMRQQPQMPTQLTNQI